MYLYCHQMWWQSLPSFSHVLSYTVSINAWQISLSIIGMNALQYNYKIKGTMSWAFLQFFYPYSNRQKLIKKICCFHKDIREKCVSV